MYAVCSRAAEVGDKCTAQVSRRPNQREVVMSVTSEWAAEAVVRRVT